MHVRSIAPIASVLLAFILFLGSASAQSCSDVPSEHEAVAETVRTMYAGAAKDDYSTFRKVLAPGFYAFDGGKRFDGVALLDYVKTEYQDKGYVFVWKVTDPAVHTACDTAWITYTNVGSVTDPSGKVMPMQWLESAFLQKEGERWLIRFFQSTRVPPSPAKG
jgi:hypothetical protein